METDNATRHEPNDILHLCVTVSHDIVKVQHDMTSLLVKYADLVRVMEEGRQQMLLPSPAVTTIEQATRVTRAEPVEL